MSDRPLDEWVERAEQDYRAAIALDAEDVPAVVSFHAQQCVGKYLKAALSVHGQTVPRTHDLIDLVEMVEKHDPRFGRITDRLDALMPYSVAARYPGMEVSGDDAHGARRAMCEARAQIRALLGLGDAGAGGT